MKAANMQLGSLQVGIILLTLITAVIHFTLVFPSALFILNALGYLALLAALYLPIPQLRNTRHLARWALMGYTALTVVLWVVMGSRIPIAYVAKVDELVLIGLLWLDSRQAKVQFGVLPVAIVLLTLFTAGCHLYLGLRGLGRPLNLLTVAFILNGLGYLALLAAMNLPIPQLAGYRHQVPWALMGFTALTVLVWVVLNAGLGIGSISLATVTKADELVLISLLSLGSWRT